MSGTVWTGSYVLLWSTALAMGVVLATVARRTAGARPRPAPVRVDGPARPGAGELDDEPT
ncbi:MAG: hypothetical protein ACK5PP_15890 [Acidimicrobiales bacterium]